MISRLIVMLMIVLLPMMAAAQSTFVPKSEPAKPSEPLTKEEVAAMVARLSDEEVRAMLLKHLDAQVAEKNGGGESIIDGLEALGDSAAQGFRDGIVHAFVHLPNLPGAIVSGFGQFWEIRGLGGTLHLLAVGAAAILFGLLGEALLRQLIRRYQRRLETTTPEGLRATVWLLFQRFVIEVAQILVFLLASWLIIHNFEPPERLSHEILWVFITVPVLYTRLMSAAVSFLFAPRHPELRLVHTDDATARFLDRGLIVATLIVGLGQYVLMFLSGHGVALEDVRIAFWLNLALLIWLVWVIWHAREGLKLILRGRDRSVSTAEAWVASAYPAYAIILTVFFWALREILSGQGRWDLLDGRITVTQIFLIFAPALDTMVRGLVHHLAPPMTGTGVQAEAAWARTQRGLIRIGRVLCFGVVILIVARLWDFSFFSVAKSGFGEQIAGRLISVAGILITGYIIWEAVTLWANRKLAAEQTAAGIDLTAEEPSGGEGGGVGGSRLATVLPLITLFLQTAVIAFTVLIALGNIGIDVTPLLAGAGIVGLAIGFGAQKLVADVVSGIFFLIDDAFRTGEFVEVGDTVGTVEKISIRSLQLRHHRGAVHTIPFGAIPKLTNFSRDWVIVKLKFTLPFEADLEKVRKIFKKIGQEMMEVPEFAADFLQPFKSQGVYAVDDVGIIIRGKFMAIPGRQFTLRKEIYRRVQEAFEENDIAFARKEVRVRIEGENDEEEDVMEKPSRTEQGAAGGGAVIGGGT
ncbi:mechanosensitive ion channel [Rhodobacteraceae bacterium NNCM2]|nr:mechanosensitive ion channel [Coraliihabitans acroporae]